MRHIVTAMLIALMLAACGDEESTGPGQMLPPAVVSVVVTPASATLVSLGETVQLTANAQDANGTAISSKTFTWSSSDANVATVNTGGLVTPVANGSVTIAATTDGLNGTADVAVAIECPALAFAGHVLVDGSRDGGVWWFPQGNNGFDQDEDHQGKALADYLRNQGYVVNELGRDETLTDELARSHRIIIRSNRFGPPYGDQELAAYRNFLACETTLVLLSDHQTHTDGEDELADILGIDFVGTHTGNVTVFSDHAITQGLTAVSYIAGAHVVAHDPSAVEILGWLSDGQPVMGVIDAAPAKVFFFGDVNALETVTQPLIDNLIAWGF